MFDILFLFFSALKHAVNAISNPAEDIRTRMMQYTVLVSSTLGCCLIAFAVYLVIAFNFNGVWWFWSLLIGAAFCAVAGVMGVMITQSGEAKA